MIPSLRILKALVRREIIKSFHKSILGVFWHLIIPVFQLYIVFHVYGYVSKQNSLRAAISGLLIWFLFNNAVSPSIQLVRSSSALMRQFNLKAHYFAATSLVMSIIYALLFLFVALFFVFKYHIVIHSGIVVGLAVILLFCLFIYSISVVVSVGNLFFRDLGKLWSPISFLMFLTAPILYPKNAFPGYLQYISQVNPLTQFLESLRTCLEQDVGIAITLVPWNVLLFIVLFTGSMAYSLVYFSNRNLIANL